MRVRTILGEYFCCLVPSDISSSRNILLHTLTRNGVSIWSTEAKPNRRRCVEGSSHLLSAKLLSRAMEEMCNMSSVCAYIKANCGFVLARNLILLVEMMGSRTSETCACACVEDMRRVHHYMRWIRENMSTINDKIQKQLQRASPNILSESGESVESIIASNLFFTQPIESIVRQDFIRYLSMTKGEGLDRSFSGDHLWVRGVILGGKSSFSSLEMTLKGHELCVTALSWSHDNKRVASGSIDGTIRVADTRSGLELNVLRLYPLRTISHLDWSSDNAQIASAYRSSFETHIWDSSTGVMEFSLVSQACVCGIEWSTCVGKLAICTEDCCVAVWNTVSGICAEKVDCGNLPICFLRWRPCGGKLAFSSGRTSLHVWTLTDTTPEQCWRGEEAEIVLCVVWTAKSLRIVVGCEISNPRMYMWDSVAGCVGDASLALATSSTGSDNSGIVYCDINTCIFNPVDTNIVAFGLRDNGIRLWNVELSTPPVCLQGHSRDITPISSDVESPIEVWDSLSSTLIMVDSRSPWGVVSLAWSRDGKAIASGSADNTNSVRLWQTSDPQSISPQTNGHSGHVSDVQMSPCGLYVASGSFDGSVCIWDKSSLCLLTKLRVQHKVQQLKWSVSLAERHLAIVSSDEITKSIIVWNVETRSIIFSLGDLRAVVYNPSSCLVAASSHSQSESIVFVFETMGSSPRIPITAYRGHSGTAYSLTWSPDGTKIASKCIGQSIHVWDAKTETFICDLGGDNTMAWGPDGSFLVSSSVALGLRLRESLPGAATRTIENVPEAILMSISPNARYISCAFGDYRICIYDLSSLSPVSVITGDSTAFLMSWCPDNRKLIILCNSETDTTARIYDASVGSVDASLYHTDSVLQ
jgi:WD40 repeat protein